MLSRALVLCSFFIVSFFSLAVTAADDQVEPFIEGYSPVSYFTVGKAEKGSAEFAVEHDGKQYYLTSAEQVALFNMNPDKYQPLFDVCPYSLSLGKRVPLNPTNFKIVAGDLLLFHKSDKADGRILWNQGEAGLTETDLINRAKKQYLLFEWD